MRTFIAIELPTSLHPDIHAMQLELAAGLEPRLTPIVRWTPAANVHLTLRFLGESSPEQCRAIVEQVCALAATIPSFELVLRGVGCFPGIRKPSIIWLGVDDSVSKGRMGVLQRSIEAISVRAGFAPEERAYTPHLTLARLARFTLPGERASVGESVQRLSQTPRTRTWQRTVMVTQIALMQSELHAQGSRYTALDRMALLPVDSNE